jgi:hypothetical protein
VLLSDSFFCRYSALTRSAGLVAHFTCP